MRLQFSRAAAGVRVSLSFTARSLQQQEGIWQTR
jgi:hypothetical protein